MVEQSLLTIHSKNSLKISNDLISGFQEIISENNHATLYSKMVEISPEILNFECAGLLFKNQIKKNLYSASIERGKEGELYIWDVIDYPCIGLTGAFFSETNPRTSMVMYQPQKDPEYIQDIDNMTGLSSIRNIVYLKLVYYQDH